MKKIIVLIAIVLSVFVIQTAFAQDELSMPEAVTITQSEDGRYVGSDGYEYFLMGSAGITEEDILAAASRTDGDEYRCPTIYAPGGGSAVVCSSWVNNNHLKVQVKLTNPSNGYATACYVIAYTNTIVDCSGEAAAYGNWTTWQNFTSATYGAHAGGFKFYTRGNRIQ